MSEQIHHSDDLYAVWRTADNSLWRLATDQEVAAQIEHDATRSLSKYERTRPKRKSTKTHRDLVAVVIVRDVFGIEPVGVADKPSLLPHTPVAQIRATDLIECVNATQSCLSYAIHQTRNWQAAQRAQGK